MTTTPLAGLRAMEGKQVRLVLSDRRSAVEGTLVSAGRSRVTTAWLFDGENDLFVPFESIGSLSVLRAAPTAA